MTDPTFATRAALAQWAIATARGAGSDKQRQIAALDEIRRVTAAHKHLMGGNDDD